MAKKTPPTGKAVKKSAGKRSSASKRPRRAADAERQTKIRKALYEIADAASAVTDMQEFYRKLHNIVGKLMYAQSFYVTLYDAVTGMLSSPYFADEAGDTAPPPTRIDSASKSLRAYVLLNGKTLHVSRTEIEEGRLLGRFTPMGTPAEDWIGVPLKMGGQVIGSLTVQSYKKRIRYTEQDVKLLEFVAQHIAVALTRARAIDETRQRNSELAIINSVQNGLASKLEMQGIYDLVGDKVREIFDANTVTLATFDLEKNLMHPRYAFEKGQRFFIEPLPIPEVYREFIQRAQPLLINSNLDKYVQRLDPNAKPLAGEMPKSVLAIPLIMNGALRGIVSLQNIDRENAFSESDMRLLQTLANSMSVALENARLFDETQRLLKETEQRNAELAILNSVGEAMVKTLDVKTVTRIVGDKVRDIFSADQMGILLFDQQTNLIHLMYGYDKANSRYVDDLQIKPIPLGKGLTSKVVESRQPLLLSTREEQNVHGHYMPPELVGQIKMSESWLGVPIMVEENVLGAVFVEDYRPHAYNENHLRLLQTLSSNMGVAIQNARLFDETQQRNAELAIINSVQNGLASKLEMQEIYELVGEKLREIFQQADLSVGVYDPETDMASAPYVIEKGARISFPTIKLNGRGIVGHMLQEPKSLLFDDEESLRQASIQYKSADITGSGLPKSALYVPLMMGGNMRGVIALQDFQKEHAFKESDVRLLETLANSMSVALENARLWEQEKKYRKALQRELEIGREIQAGFLPEALPVIEGWEVAASLMSAREVAGDFYDAFELPDGNIGLVIADVCDKGVGAALFMTLFRSLIRAAANLDYFEHTEKSDAPHSSTERLQRAISLTNNYIAETHGESGMFATLFFGILDPRDGRLAYVNGGHEPPLIVQSGIVRETLHKTGPAVGAMLNRHFEIVETQLRAGDMLFAFTDGAPDARDPRGEFYGRERLLNILQRAGNSSLELVKAIESELRDHIASATQFDDITLLAVKRI